jgi:hypothetical protein
MNVYRSWVSSFCEPFRTGGLKLADGEVVPVYPGQQWAPTMAWDNYGGKVTLAGDAAHSMVPRKCMVLPSLSLVLMGLGDMLIEYF